MTTLYYEEVQERYAGVVLRSTVRPATDEEVAECRRLHADGKCPHTIIIDTPGWLYNFRDCAVCGASLGTV